jgi:hypothetical protein
VDAIVASTFACDGVVADAHGSEAAARRCGGNDPGHETRGNGGSSATSGIYIYNYIYAMLMDMNGFD